MKRNLFVITMLLGTLFWSCQKDAFWNNETQQEQGRIVGQLVSDEANSPIAGVKILIERQTGSDGVNSFVDTVSTDTKGEFQYEVPLPNKVRLVVRDTGRFAADTAEVEVLAAQDYRLTMQTHPRFGTANIVANILDSVGTAIKGVRLALLVRETNIEEYSPVDTFVTDENGRVLFEDIAFPVNYKVALAEHPLAYSPSSQEGKITTKDQVTVELTSKRLFDIGDVRLSAKYHFTDEPASNVPVRVLLKSVFDEEFKIHELSFDDQGNLTLPDVNYPATIKILPQSLTEFPFREVQAVISSENINQDIVMPFYDIHPRFESMTPSSQIAENTLTAFYGDLAVRTMEVDSKGNIYAVTEEDELVRIPFDGSSHTVLASGFTTSWGIALQDDSTFYVVENSNGHKIKKVNLDPSTDQVSISVLAGQNSSGTKDGTFAEATFNRPGDAVYDSKRNVLWVAEWTNQRLRKLDLNNGQVSTMSEAAIGFGFGISLSADKNKLYIGSHSSQSGIQRFDIEANLTTRVYSGGSIRHVLVTPDDKVFFIDNKSPNLFTVPNAAGNTSSTRTIVAGNNAFGGLKPIGYTGSAEVSIADKNVDGSPTGLVYDAFSGRLYMSVPGDKRIYYVQSKTIK